MKPLIVHCPCCGIELDIDRESGKIVRTGPRPGEKEGVDRFDDIVQTVKKKSGQGASAFDKVTEELRGRERTLDTTFQDALRKARSKDDGERPLNPLDMD